MSLTRRRKWLIQQDQNATRTKKHEGRGARRGDQKGGGVKNIIMPLLTIKDESFAFCFAQVHMTRAKGA